MFWFWGVLSLYSNSKTSTVSSGVKSSDSESDYKLIQFRDDSISLRVALFKFQAFNTINCFSSALLTQVSVFPALTKLILASVTLRGFCCCYCCCFKLSVNAPLFPLLSVKASAKFTCRCPVCCLLFWSNCCLLKLRWYRGAWLAVQVHVGAGSHCGLRAFSLANTAITSNRAVPGEKTALGYK